MANRPGAGASKAAEAYVEISTDQRKLDVGLGQVQQKLKNMAKGAAVVGAGMSAAAGGIFGGLYNSLRAFAVYGDSIQDAAARTGLTTEGFSELAHVANLAGSSMSGVERGVRGMQRFLLDLSRGTAEQVWVFKQLGLQLEDIQALAPEDQFKAIAVSIAGINDASMRAAIAMRIFSRGGSELVPIFKMGAGAMRDAFEMARKLGIVLSQSVADAAGDLNDRFYVLRMGLLGIKIAIARAVTPVFMELTKKLLDVMIFIRMWLQVHPKFVTGLAQLAKWLGIVGVVVTTVAGGIMSLTSSWLSLAASSAAAGGIIAALMSLADAFGLIDTGFNDLKDSLSEWAPAAKSLASGVIDTLKAGAKSFIAILLEGLKYLDTGLVRVVTSLAQNIMNALKKIKIFGQPIVSEKNAREFMESFDIGERAALSKRQFGISQWQSKFRAGASADALSAQKNFMSGGMQLLDVYRKTKAQLDAMEESARAAAAGASPASGGIAASLGVTGFFGGRRAGEMLGGMGMSRILEQQVEYARETAQNTSGILGAIEDGDFAGAYG